MCQQGDSFEPFYGSDIFFWKCLVYLKDNPIQKELERQIEMFHLLIHFPQMPPNNWNWTRSKWGTQNSIQVSSTVSKDTNTWAIVFFVTGCILAGRWNRRVIQIPKPWHSNRECHHPKQRCFSCCTKWACRWPGCSFYSYFPLCSFVGVGPPPFPSLSSLFLLSSTRSPL